MGCLYDEYARTYRTVADALLRRDEATVRRHCTMAWQAQPRCGTSARAVADALNRMPMRARVHLCRLRLDEPCASGRCQREAGLPCGGGPAPVTP